MLLQRYSLQESGVEAVVVEAFDINEVANDVYEHNFGHRPSQVSVLSLGFCTRYGIKRLQALYSGDFA